VNVYVRTLREKSTARSDGRRSATAAAWTQLATPSLRARHARSGLMMCARVAVGAGP
jgi:hypothetical protein